MTDSYYAYGTAKERLFVRHIAPLYGLDAQIHPAKSIDPYHPDLLVGTQIADLKSKEDPFFTALDKFGVDPQYCITFDTHDMKRYKTLFPRIHIYFWVVWTETELKIGKWTYKVEPMNHVYVGTLDQIEQAHVGIHSRRVLPSDTSKREAMVLSAAGLTELQRV